MQRVKIGHKSRFKKLHEILYLTKLSQHKPMRLIISLTNKIVSFHR